MSIDRGLIHRPSERDEALTQERCFILESWNRTEDPGLSVARARVAPGVATRRHRLVGIVERYLILAGEGILSLDGMAPTRVGPGDLAYIPAGLGQCIHNTGAEDLVFLAICTPRFQPSAYLDIDPSPMT